MRMLIVSCVFPPEPVTSATTSAELAAELVDTGHDVSVITAFPSRPGGVLYDGFRRSWRRAELASSGYQLIRTFSSHSPRRTVCEHFFENVSFGLTASLSAMMEKADVVYANIWPLFAADLLSRVCRARRIPFVWSVQDIHPEAALTLGKLPMAGPIPWLLKRIDRGVAHRATALVAISQQFADFYHTQRGVPRERIHVVSNWMDESRVIPGARVGWYRRSQGIAADQFIAMYAGNVGNVAGVELLLDAAELLRDNPSVLFVVAGDGSQRSVLEARARDCQLTNVRFHYPWRPEEINDVHAAADVLVLPTRRSAAVTSVPSKLIAYMLAGRPVLAAVEADSPTARLIADARCGVCIPPESPAQFVEQIRTWRVHPDVLSDLGNRGRAYAERHCSRKVCLPKLISILESATGTAASAEPQPQEVTSRKHAA